MSLYFKVDAEVNEGKKHEEYKLFEVLHTFPVSFMIFF